MKVLFIYPKFIKFLENFPGIHFAGGERFTSYPYPAALGIPSLVANTPEKHEYTFVDENIEEIDYDTDADVIAVSFFTAQASNAYEICTKFRERGKLVVVGGMHPSICHEEASTHADIVCRGEGELLWPVILDDIERGCSQEVYCQTDPVDINALPVPFCGLSYERADKYEMHLDYLELSRGCDIPCGTCVVPVVAGKKLRLKRLDKVIEAVETLRFPMCFIADDILLMRLHEPAIRGHVHEVFHELERTNKDHGFVISTVPGYPIDDETLKVMRRGGVSIAYSTYGFEPMTNSILIGDRTSRTQKVAIIEQIKAIQDAGILAYAAFHLGFDQHTVAVRDNILEFCHEANIKLAQFCLKVPWPGTRIWDELSRQGRIIHKDWRRYNGANAVFVPKLMTVDELEGLFVSLWQEYSEGFHRLNELQRSQVVDYNAFENAMRTGAAEGLPLVDAPGRGGKP